jgi:HK97 family phage portal protein
VTLHRLREARGATAPKTEERAAGLTSYSSGGWGMLDPTAVPPPGTSQTMRAGVPVTAHTSLQVDAVFTAMRAITNSIIKLGDPRAYITELSNDNIPFKSWTEDQPTILYDTFGPGMFQYDGRRRTVMSMGIFGEAFWHILTRDTLAYPTAIEVLHPAFMEMETGPSGVVFKYGTGSKRTELDPENVVHIPFMSMPGGMRGLSAIEYGGVAFALAIAAMEYGQRWFSQGASPSYFLSTEGKLGRDEIERIAEKFMVDHSGLGNSHLPLILDSGMKAEKIQSTPDEAQYLQTLEYARSVVASFFGVPQFLMLNALQRNTPEPPGVIQERSMVFLQYTLSGYLIPLEEAYSSLIPQEFSAAFDTTRFAEADAKSRAAELMALRNTQVATINDIRTRQLALPPLSDPRADDPWAPLASNVAPEQTPGASPPHEHDPNNPNHGGEPDPTNSPDDTL